MTAAFTAGYEAGKTEGYDKGYSAAWNDALEAAAELMHKQTAYPESGDEWEHAADAIRKLKKP